MAFLRAGCIAVGLLVASAGLAQTPASPPAGVAAPGGVPTSSPAPAARPAQGNVVGRSPLPRNRVPPRTFQQCNQEALSRHYRGAERRHYVARCQLGVRRLFRRRGRGGTVAGQAPAPIVQPSR